MKRADMAILLIGLGILIASSLDAKWNGADLLGWALAAVGTARLLRPRSKRVKP